jgi:hypothetical protein
VLCRRMRWITEDYRFWSGGSAMPGTSMTKMFAGFKSRWITDNFR